MPVANNELLKEIRIMASKLEKVTDTVHNLEQKTDKDVLDINNELEAIHKQFSNAMLEIKNELDLEMRHMHEKVNSVTNANNNMQKSLELSISGIPDTDGENLHTTISRISQLIMFEDIKSIVRLHRLKPTQQSSSSLITNIIVCFTTTHSRRLFLSKYFAFIKNIPLKLSHIGINSDDRIYVNENLSKQSLELLKKAKSLMKTGKIAGVYTRDGHVCVFHRKDDKRFEIVSNSDDLKKYENLF